MAETPAAATENVGTVKTHTKRFRGWWLITIVALVVVAATAEQQLGVLAYKLLQVTLGVILAYFADRALFKSAVGVSKDMPHDVFGASRLLARAIVVLAIILGLTIGI